jgi:pyridoxamine 5'-phosphate oxidase
MSSADADSELFPLANILHKSQLDPDPLRQFQKWFDEAVTAGVALPEAMTLATATPDGRPSARTVLLRGVDERGFTFFTNYESRKGRELAANARAALVFFWQHFDRQVLVEGQVEKCSTAESDAYFASRPRGSRLGAWASPQSEVLANRDMLDQRVKAVQEQYASTEDLPRPAWWGGFRVLPTVIEFWQGQPSRLHDRIRYRRQSNGTWVMERLAP